MGESHLAGVGKVLLTVAERRDASAVRTAVLSSPNEILALGESAHALLSRGTISMQPKFFLSTISPKIWAPRAVVVHQGSAPAGIVYFKERRAAGFLTGVVFGDSSLDSMIVAAVADREWVFRAAVDALLQQKRVQSLRLVVAPGSPELSTLLALAGKSLDVSQTPIDYHSVLELPSSYEGFLDGLGSRTRRNFRYYRQRSEAADHCYVEEISFPEFHEIAFSLLKESVVGADLKGVKRALNIFAAVDRPLLVGLREKNGEWLSILGGWYESDRAIIFFQMNSDKKHARFSLSTVLRAHLIESLIENGTDRLVFWAGVGGPLSRYVKPVPAVAVYVDAQNLAWRTLRRFINSHRNWVPALLGEWVGGPSNGCSALTN